MSKKILVVDDEPQVVEMIEKRLKTSGYEVIAAYDGLAALEKVKSEPPDLIVLDIMLPKMDGYKVCGLLKSDARYSKIPVILFTAKGQEEDMRVGEEAGADVYITKPCKAQVLLANVRELLGPEA